jgi:hypothetical protein
VVVPVPFAVFSHAFLGLNESGVERFSLEPGICVVMLYAVTHECKSTIYPFDLDKYSDVRDRSPSTPRSVLIASDAELKSWYDDERTEGML